MSNIVNKDFKTTVSVRVKDGTRTFVWPFKNEIEHNGNASDPALVIRILEEAMAQVKSEASQTTLPEVDKPDLAPKKITGEKKPETPKK